MIHFHPTVKLTGAFAKQVAAPPWLGQSIFG